MQLSDSPGANECEALTTTLEEVTVIKLGAWEKKKGNHLCPESMESLPGTEAGNVRIPESLTKESCIFKKLFKGLALCKETRRWEPGVSKGNLGASLSQHHRPHTQGKAVQTLLTKL